MPFKCYVTIFSANLTPISHPLVTLITLDCALYTHPQILRYVCPLLPPAPCGVAGIAETFPFLPVSGLFFPDLPGFHVPSDSVLPSQPGSFSRALPLRLHFGNCSDVFCSISSVHVPEPLQTSQNDRNQFHLSFLQHLLISPMFHSYPSHHPHL